MLLLEIVVLLLLLAQALLQVLLEHLLVDVDLALGVGTDAVRCLLNVLRDHILHDAEPLLELLG